MYQFRMQKRVCDGGGYMKRIKMNYHMKVALGKAGYDFHDCKCIFEDDQAWLFETITENVEEKEQFWVEKKK